MTRRPISDALIHEALVLDAGGPLPAGVLEAISDGIRRTRQDRPLLARLGVVSGLVGARPERGSQDRSRTWALVMVGALLALVVGMLIVGGGSGPGPLPSATTESPAASADATPTASLVPLTGEIIIRIAPAADGGLWVAGTSGGLDSPKVWRGTEAGGTWESVGAQSGFIRSIDILPDGRPIVTIDSGLKQRDNGVWVRGDDGVWDRVIDRESTVLHVARDGTAWMALYEGETPVLRAYRVDGGVWTELATVDRPAGGTLLDEGPDGSIWTAGINYSGSGGVARCTIAGCEVVLPRTAEIADLAVAPDGRVAVVVGVPIDASPGLFDWRTDELIEGSWMTVREHTWPTEIAYTPDGSLWAFGDDGSLERRDETGAWITKVSSGLPSMFSLTVGPDGRIWWADREAAPGDQLRHLDPTE